MKAVVFYEPGGIDKLKYEENYPDPKIGNHDVLIRVKTSSLNHLDIWVRNGIPAYKAPMPHIGGCEGAGIVEKIGTSVKSFKIGDEVIISPGQPCFQCEFCRSGEESTCLNFKVFGGHTQGAFAELAVIPEIHLIPKPKSISFEEAAAFPLVYLTAWHMLISRAKLRSGETVLVVGAGSGVGTAAIQIAKFAGANVIALSSTSDKLAKSKEIGADEIIDYTKEDFHQKVMEITDRKGVDLVFEHVGPATFDKSLKSLAKNGRLVTCGATTGPEAKIDIRYIFSRQLTILGSMLGIRNELLKITKLMKEKKLVPVIDSVYPLKELTKAESKMESGQQFGKIVIKI